MDTEKPDVEHSDAKATGVDPNKTAKVVPLRIWPAVLLILLVWGLRFVGVFADEPSMSLMMAVSSAKAPIPRIT